MSTSPSSATPAALLTREDDGIMRLRLGGMPVPILFTLVAATEPGA